jgi:ArsR family transcriptional regulator
LIQLKSKFYQNEENSILFNYLEAFGNKERFLILNMLKEKDRCVCELEAILQKTQPAVSHHLRILEKNNLIQATKVGKFSHYSLVRSEFEKFQNMWKNWTDHITNWFGI